MYTEHETEYGHKCEPMSKLDNWQIRDEDLDSRGWGVFDKSDNKIGKVSDLIVDVDDRRVRYIVVAYEQTLGIGGSKKLIPANMVTLYPDKDRAVFDGDPEDLKNSPDYETDVTDYSHFSDYWKEKEHRVREAVSGRKGGERGAVMERVAERAKEREKFDLNSASRDELIAIKGIGPVLADHIISYRKEHGKFKSFNELDNVPGISRETIDDIKKHAKL
jgi:competence ComEA-like helix-hairpin-helix protein